MAHWPRADIPALLGIVVTILVALMTPVRRTLIRFADWISFRLGFPARRYRRRFNERYRLLENVYLNNRFVDAYTDPASARWPFSSAPAAEHTPEVNVPSSAES